MQSFCELPHQCATSIGTVMPANSVRLAPPSTAGPGWEAVFNLKPHIGHDAIGCMVMTIAC